MVRGCCVRACGNDLYGVLSLQLCPESAARVCRPLSLHAWI